MACSDGTKRTDRETVLISQSKTFWKATSRRRVSARRPPALAREHGPRRPAKRGKSFCCILRQRMEQSQVAQRGDDGVHSEPGLKNGENPAQDLKAHHADTRDELPREMPTRLSSITRSNSAMTIASNPGSSYAKSATNKIAVTPQGVTMIGVANGVIAGCLAGAAADGGDDAGRLNCPIISHEAANRRMPPAIRKSSRETRHDAATPVITKAIKREIAIAAVVPLSARARAADGVKFWVIEKKAGTVLIGPTVNMKMVKMNAGVIISVFPSGAVPARPRTARSIGR
jgi:hypothetical protein